MRHALFHSSSLIASHPDRDRVRMRWKGPLRRAPGARGGGSCGEPSARRGVSSGRRAHRDRLPARSGRPSN